MVHDQADELRQLVRQKAGSSAARGPAAPLVVVSGAKGGVGTTTIAANLAVALARQGRRAVLVDADLDHGGHAPLNQHGDRGSVVDVLAGRRDVHDVLQRGPAGIQVLSGAWPSGEPTDFPEAALARFVAELAALAPHAEVVVVDAGSGRGPLVRRLWQAAAAVIVVTTTDDAAIMQGYAAIKVLAGCDDAPPIQTLANLAPDAAAAAAAQGRIAEACRKFLGLRAAAGGSVAWCDTSSCEPVLEFPPRGEAGRSMDRLADTLWAQLQLESTRETIARRAAIVAS